MENQLKEVVKINNLSFYFGNGELRKQILFDIELRIKSGEIIIMTGPSGSGKTTLLTLIGALRSIQQGSLCVLNNELNQAKEYQLIKVRRQIGYIFQAHNLLKSLTTTQNVQMSLELHSNISGQNVKERAVNILETVGLGAHLDKYPDQLSGGQKQRVAIARALANNPQLILADEPTAALDSKSGRNVVEILQRLVRERNCTILLVTHDNRILNIADRIIQMEDGKLIEK